MDKPKFLITITDGVSTEGDAIPSRFSETARLLKERRVFSLSCGIGRKDVDHERLALLAMETGGLHIVVFGSAGIARALEDLTGLIIGYGESLIAQNEEHLVALQRSVEEVHRIAVDVMLLIDSSPSMVGYTSAGSYEGDTEKLKHTKLAAKALVDSLNREHDRIGVARFWDGFELLSSPTSDFEAVKRRIDAIDTNGGTGLFQAMSRAITAL